MSVVPFFFGAQRVFEVSPAAVVTTGTEPVVLPKPTGTVSGDFLLSYCQIVNATSFTPASGFNEHFDANEIEIASKVAGGSEPTDYSFSATGVTGLSVGTMLRVERAVFDQIGSASSSGTTPAAPAITLPQPGYLFAIFWRAGTGTFTTPDGMEPLADFSGSGRAFAIFGQNVGAGDTGTRISTASGNSRGILVSIISA